VSGEAQIFGNARVYGNVRVSGEAQVYGDVWVSGEAWVYDNALVYGKARVSGDAIVSGDAWVSGDAIVSGEAQVISSNHIVWLTHVGSEGGTLTAYTIKTGEIEVTRGCFRGTLDQFAEAVQKTHGTSRYGEEYLLLIEFIRLRFRGVVVEGETGVSEK
jgi:predicted acyltransferase (DUF342 family)